MADRRRKGGVKRRSSRAPVRTGRRRDYRASRAVPMGVRARRRTLPRLIWITPGRVAGTVLAAAIVAALIFAFVDERFYVRQTEINGLQFTAREQIETLAGVEDYSVFWVNGREIAGRLEQLPFVKSARVRSTLPDRVRIDLVERQPVATWIINGQAFWVDDEGVVLPVAAQVEGLPLLDDREGRLLGDGSSVDMNMLASVLALHSYLPEVKRFAYDRARGLHFTTADGTVVALGQPEGLEQRVVKFKTLSAQLADEAVGEINLQHEGGFFFRPAQ